MSNRIDAIKNEAVSISYDQPKENTYTYPMKIIEKEVKE